MEKVKKDEIASLLSNTPVKDRFSIVSFYLVNHYEPMIRNWVLQHSLSLRDRVAAQQIITLPVEITSEIASLFMATAQLRHALYCGQATYAQNIRQIGTPDAVASIGLLIDGGEDLLVEKSAVVIVMRICFFVFTLAVLSSAIFSWYLLLVTIVPVGLYFYHYALLTACNCRLLASHFCSGIVIDELKKGYPELTNDLLKGKQRSYIDTLIRGQIDLRRE